MRRILFLLFLTAGLNAGAQYTGLSPAFTKGIDIRNHSRSSTKEEIRVSAAHWKMDKNKMWSGALVFLAGFSKGFNESLQFHWKEFHRQFPKANAQWFNPSVSWRNKYKNGDPDQGPRSFLSTSVLIGFTDQYHLNNLVNRISWTGALVINIGGGKKPFRQYLLDMAYFTVCHYAGFASSYYPFSKYKGK